VLPGNVDGPDSPQHGRAGWTWYTGAAQWLHRVVTHWVLGVRPEWDGLRIDPVLPLGWTHARLTRPWRGSTYVIEIERDPRLAAGEVGLTLDGEQRAGNVLPLPAREGGTCHVQVRCS
jgi:cellobiose phosphorylase